MEQFLKKHADISVISAGILWGIIGIFVNSLGNKGLSAFDMMLVRSFFALVVIFLFLFICDREKLKINLKDIWIFMCLGIVSFFMYGVLYFITIEKTSMSTAAVLLYTSPVFIMVMARMFFKEKITKRKLLAILVTVMGTALVSGGIQKNSDISGLITGILSGFFYGLYSIFGRLASKKYSSVTTTLYTFLFTTFAAIGVADFGNIVGAVRGYPVILGEFILYAVITAAIPYILYTGALKYVPLSRAAIVVCVEPIVAMITGVIFYGDKLGVMGLSGSLMILGAILLSNTEKGL